MKYFIRIVKLNLSQLLRLSTPECSGTEYIHQNKITSVRPKINNNNNSINFKLFKNKKLNFETKV